MQRPILPLLIALLVGCSQAQGPATSPGSCKMMFRQAQLDGSELADLLEFKCVKYTYSGPEIWCFWRLTADLYGPDDQLVSTTLLSGGGAGLTHGTNLSFSIPADTGGNVVTRLGMGRTKFEIPALIPSSAKNTAWGFNQHILIADDKPVLIGIFASGTTYGMHFPNHKIPKGHKGHILGIYIQFKQASVEQDYPWSN